MNTNEIDYNDVGTFPKFSRAVIKILLEMLKWMITKQPPARKIGDRYIFLPIHVMKMFGFSLRKMQRVRSDGEMEYMISDDGQTIFHYDTHIQQYIDSKFVSSRSPEAEARMQKRCKKANLTNGSKSGARHK